jgi:hypothetical protein
MSHKPLLQSCNLVLRRPILDPLLVAKFRNPGLGHPQLSSLLGLLEQADHQYSVPDVEVLAHESGDLIGYARIAGDRQVALTEHPSKLDELLIHLGPLVANLA